MKYLYFFIIIFLGLEACQDGQAARSRDAQIKQALALAAQSGEKEDYNEQLVQLEKVVALSRQTNDSLGRWIRANTQIADLLDLDLGKRLESMERLQAADRELAAWRSPQTVLENQFLLRHYLLDAYISVEVGDLPRAQKVLEKAEPVFKNKVFGTNDTIARNFYKQIANLYVRLGEFKIAEQYFEESKVYKTISGETGVANYNDYGSVFLSQNDYKSALLVFNQGLAEGTQDYYNQTLLYLNKAEALARLGEIQASVETNEFAGLMLQDTSKWAAIRKTRRARCQIGYLENKGIIAEEQKDWIKEGECFHQIVNSSLAGFLPRREIAAYLANEADAFLQQHLYDKAMTRYHDAYMQFYPSATKDGILELPAATDLLTDKILADVLEGKARCFAQMHQYDPALMLYDLIPVVEAQLRATHTFESSSLFALKRSRKRLDDAVELSWEALQKTGDKKYAKIAFRFTEMARGVLQTKGVRASDAYATLNDEQKEKDKSFSTGIATAENELAEIEKNDDPKVNEIMQRIRDLKKEQKAFRSSVMKSNPVYAAEMSNDSVIPLEGLSKLLRKDQVLFDFYVVDSTAVHVFLADHQGSVCWRRIDWPITDQQALNSLIVCMSKRNDEQSVGYFTATAFRLYKTLLEPGLMQKDPSAVCTGKEYPQIGTSLLIIPDMELSGLSFEALLTDSVPVPSWSGLPYLIKKYSVGYAYSASLLQLQQNITLKRANGARIPFAGFAPVYQNGSLRLTGAENDVLFGQKLFGGEAFSGHSASEDQFRHIAEDAKVLLLSMHGYSNHLEPGLSKLCFGDSTGEISAKNNVLTAGELQNIPCRADLAILSACETGDGPVEKGEGVYSLARAFTISGVPSTVMSFWQLPDNSSSNMVQDFLLDIHGNHFKDVALQNAKLKWLKDSDGSNTNQPYYWACLVAAGDMAPVSVSGNSKWVYWLLFSVLVTAGVVYFRKRQVK